MSGGIGSSLHAARKHRGWTRETLAHHSGVSWSAIAQIESGRRTDIRLPTLLALADALGVSMDSLAGRPAQRADMFDHRAVLYESDEEFVETAASFVRRALDADEPVLVVTTPRRGRALRRALAVADKDVEFRDSKRWYCDPIAALTAYRTFLMDRLAGGARWVCIVGEPVWAGCSDEEVATWIRYEALLNLAFARYPATLLCPYARHEVPDAALASAEMTHPRVAAGTDTAPSPSYRDPEQFLIDAIP